VKKNAENPLEASKETGLEINREQNNIRTNYK
jgi:hypothetical protein